MKKNESKNRIARAAAFVFLLLIFAFILFNDYGVINYLKLKYKLDELDSDIEYVENRIKKIEKEIDSLQNSNFKLEKVAREKYNMIRKGEKTLIIEDADK